MIPEDEAKGVLNQLYEKYREPWGGIDKIIKIHSLNPKSMRTQYDLYAHAMRGKSDLSRIQREIIAVATSSINRCKY